MDKTSFVTTDLMTLKGDELKKILAEIKRGETAWREEDKSLIINSMIAHIGSIDSELRDNLIYSSFYQLIIEKNLIEHEQLKEILNLCLNDLLFKGIGENGTDTVFTRSFTSLLIALILYRDKADQFLPQSSVYKTKEKLIEYLNQEQDLRGYVPIKGWAHSIAHVADAFDELVQNPKIEKQMFSEILKPLCDKLFVSSSVYIHNEDERMIVPIIEMLNQGLDPFELERIIIKLPQELKAQKERLEEEKYRFLLANCKTFLKSFYIKIKGNSELQSFENIIEKALKKITS